jgi:prolyl-tRNA editing enzyme YbaK/EbsC (Cys-tRNA(Pro) deacylase)
MAEMIDDATLEARVRSDLDGRAAAYDVMACDPLLADTAAFCAHYDVPLERSANCIIVVAKGPERRYVACVVLATTRLDVNGLVRRRLGMKKCSFASAEETVGCTDGMQIGGVTPFGLPLELPVWVDGRVVDLPNVVVGGGSRACKISVDPAVFADMAAVEIVEGLALDQRAAAE